MTFRAHPITLALISGMVAMVCGCGVPENGSGATDASGGALGSGGGGETGGIGVGTSGGDTASQGNAGNTESGTGGSRVGGTGGGTASGGSGGSAAASGGAGLSGSSTGSSSPGGASTGGANASGSSPGGATVGGTSQGGTPGGMATGGAIAGATGVGGLAAGGGGAGEPGSGGATGAGGEVGAGGTGAEGGATGTPGASCLDGIASTTSNGPFAYDTRTSGLVKMWVPRVPDGCRVPMVHYSNGTGATCSFYSSMLVRLASYGFLALCYEDMNTGAGRYGIEAFETALSEYPDLADHRFGSTGHSQGGMASLVTLQYAEAEWGEDGVYAALAMEPASGYGQTPSEGWQTVYAKIESPVFMFSGLGTDTLVSQSWVQEAFDALDDSVEAYFWAKSGANHISTINQDGNEVLISWFRWKLLGDREACRALKAIPTSDATWTVADEQNAVSCD